MKPEDTRRTTPSRARRRRRLALVSLASLGAAVAFACGSRGGYGAADEPIDAEVGDAAHEGATQEATAPPPDVPSPPDGPTDASADAPPPTWCDTLSPRPAFCADFDGVDPWAGWNVPPLTAPSPAPPRWGFVGLTDAGTSSPPHALDVSFLEDSGLPGQEAGSRFTIGRARAGGRVTTRVTFAFDFTLLASAGPASHDPLLGGLMIGPTSGDASAPNFAWGPDLCVTFPDDAGIAWPYVPWASEIGAEPEPIVSRLPLRVGERRRVELSVARSESDGSVDVELYLGRPGSPRERVLAFTARGRTFNDDETVRLSVENMVPLDAPRWRAIWDNITLSVE